MSIPLVPVRRLIRGCDSRRLKTEETTMRVMVIVKATTQSEAGQKPSEALLRQMMAFNQQLIDAGVFKGAGGLYPSSAAKRLEFSSSKRRVIDGPFTETKELIAGYWIWEVGSMDEALRWLEHCPNPDPGIEGTIEVRPMFDANECSSEASPELKADIARQYAELAHRQIAV
jgi:hypothetical protein